MNIFHILAAFSPPPLVFPCSEAHELSGCMVAVYRFWVYSIFFLFFCFFSRDTWKVPVNSVGLNFAVMVFAVRPLGQGSGGE